MKLLTQQEASEIIDKAVRLEFQNRSHGYRFGQAIWNLLPDDIARELNNTDRDFFFVTNDIKSVDMFYRYCVEKE